MTITERNIKLKQLITCLKCKLTVGRICDDCPTQYQVGTMNEIVENLEEVSKALDTLNKPHIKGDYYDGFKSGLRTAEWRYDKIRTEIKAKIIKRPWLDFEDRERDRNDAFLEVLDIIDKYKAESER